MRYIIYFFIRKFLLQKVASVHYTELQFKKISVDPVVTDNKQVYVLIKPVSFSTLQTSFLSHYQTNFLVISNFPGYPGTTDLESYLGGKKPLNIKGEYVTFSKANILKQEIKEGFILKAI